MAQSAPYGVIAKYRAIRHQNYTPKLSRGQEPASLHTRLGRWTEPAAEDRKQRGILSIVVGGVSEPLCRYLVHVTVRVTTSKRIHIRRKPEGTPGQPHKIHPLKHAAEIFQQHTVFRPSAGGGDVSVHEALLAGGPDPDHIVESMFLCA